VKQPTGETAFIKQAEYLYEKPDSAAPRILELQPDSRVRVMGTFENFVLVRSGDSLLGWTPASGVR
jgi:hypothetical protein